MLTTALIEQILQRAPSLRFGVLGDLFLDRYLDLDDALTEASLETGLAAYQVARVRSYPGAAGTVINNLAALGVGRIVPIAIIGDDGEGYELRQALRTMSAVDATHVISWPGRRTPTYGKPMLVRAGEPARELNRLDIKNRAPTPPGAEDQILRGLTEVWPQIHALLVLDQVSEPDCGVVTSRIRQHVAELAANEPGPFVLADSREQIWAFQNVHTKPNADELLRRQHISDLPDWHAAIDDSGAALARQTGRPVLCTRGANGVALFRTDGPSILVPAYPVNAPIDPVGAGDSVSAGIATAVAAGASLEDAAAFGNLVASITIQQIGTTGTASPAQVRARWQEVRK